jgi:nucleotide-binding universal stress UspA family protein
VFELTNRDGPRCLVVGYDGSVPSRNALAYAIGATRRARGKMVIVEFPPIFVYGSPMGGLFGVTPIEENFVSALPSETVSGLDEMLPGRWSVQFSQGDPASELERVSEELRADGIVVGRSSNPLRYPLGSITGKLIRLARRPVTVVP